MKTLKENNRITPVSDDESPANGARSTLQTLKVRWIGIRPLIMHNGQLADPTNKYNIAIKALTSQRGKTEDIYTQLAQLEWEGCLYWDAEKGLHIPTDNIERCIQLGAQKSKKGKLVQAAVLVTDDIVPVQYDGPKTREKMYADPRFRYFKQVVVGGSRVMRMRPMIPTGWILDFTLEYDTSLLDEKDLMTANVNAGAIYGLGDRRPKFGRFIVEFL